MGRITVWIVISGLRRILKRPSVPQSFQQFTAVSVFRKGFGRIVNGLRRIRGRGFWVGLLPEASGDWKRVDLEVFPPCHLVAGLMQLAVMTSTERNGELVTDFKADGSGLGEPQVMRVARLAAADETGL